MISALFLLALCAGTGAADALPLQRESETVTKLYDLRWIDALHHHHPLEPDLWRRGVIHLDGDWGSRDGSLHESGLSLGDFEAWSTSHSLDFFWKNRLTSPAGFQLAVGTREDHEALAADLAQLRAALRGVIRVQWMRLDDMADLSDYPAVLDQAGVCRLLEEVSIEALHSGTTLPGRGALFRPRELRALVVDLDAEGFRARPQLDPQIGVQRSGAELFAIPVPGSDGSFDVRVFVQDASALADRQTRYPTGRESVDLPALSWNSWRSSAQLPNGGGMLLLFGTQQGTEQWLLTVARDDPEAAANRRFLPLGRVTRALLAVHRLTVVLSLGGVSR